VHASSFPFLSSPPSWGDERFFGFFRYCLYGDVTTVLPFSGHYLPDTLPLTQVGLSFGSVLLPSWVESEAGAR